MHFETGRTHQDVTTSFISMSSLQQDADEALYNLLSQFYIYNCVSLLPSERTRMPGGTSRGAPIGVLGDKNCRVISVPIARGAESCSDLLEYGEFMVEVESYLSHPGTGHVPISDAWL